MTNWWPAVWRMRSTSWSSGSAGMAYHGDLDLVTAHLAELRQRGNA